MTTMYKSSCSCLLHTQWAIQISHTVNRCYRSYCNIRDSVNDLLNQHRFFRSYCYKSLRLALGLPQVVCPWTYRYSALGEVEGGAVAKPPLNPSSYICRSWLTSMSFHPKPVSFQPRFYSVNEPDTYDSHVIWSRKWAWELPALK